MKAVFIDEEKNVVIVGEPDFNYEITHTESNLEFDTKKIWVKRNESC